METKVWIRERALLPTASFPRSDLQRQDSQSGEQKGLFYENEKFTHNKFDEPVAFAASVITRQHYDSSSSVSTAGDVR
jgi:hypothetical protein